MQNIYCRIAGVIMLVFFSACENFEEINTNPNTPSKVNAKLLCPKVVLSIARFGGRDASEMISGNALPKYLTNAQTQLESQYNKIGSASFDDFTILPNIDAMVNAAQGSDNEDFYMGIAKFARAYKFYFLTMSMGDIPYTDAGKGLEGISKPKYDEQEDIFIYILDELREADQFFANAPAGNTDLGDPTPYSNNPDKWRRATNALALKVLMSLSEKADVASLDVINRFANIVSPGYLIEGTEDYFGLVYSLNYKHPLNKPSGHSNIVVSSLLIDNLKLLNDRRMYYFAEPAPAVYDSLFAIDSTTTEANPEVYAGVDVSMDFAVMKANQQLGKYSVLNERYALEDAPEPRMLITHAEQQLILAEAAIRGWISGSAQNYYEQGVISALTLMMNEGNAEYANGMPIDQDYIDNYFTGEAAFKSLEEDQLKQIWMQRYFINFAQDTRTSFFEYRRTGYPEIPINEETSLNNDGYKDRIPVRWLYPGTELNFNRENLIEALVRQFGNDYDEQNQLMWVLE